MHTNFETLSATVRTDIGTGHSRRMRLEGRIPAVVYGKGLETQSVSVDRKELLAFLRTDYGLNNVFYLDVAGDKKLCMLKNFDIDSVRREVINADFLVVALDRAIVVDVPVSTTGTSVGVKAGGRLDIVARAVRLRAEVQHIPPTVVHDVTNVELAQSIYIDELVAPEGCEFVFKNRYPVLRVAKKRGAKAEDEETATDADAAVVAA